MFRTWMSKFPKSSAKIRNWSENWLSWHLGVSIKQIPCLLKLGINKAGSSQVTLSPREDSAEEVKTMCRTFMNNNSNNRTFQIAR